MNETIAHVLPSGRPNNVRGINEVTYDDALNIVETYDRGITENHNELYVREDRFTIEEENEDIDNSCSVKEVHPGHPSPNISLGVIPYKVDSP